MIIWNGWGVLGLIVGFASMLLMQIGVNTAMQDGQYYQSTGWPKCAAFVIAAIIVWPLGRAFNRKRIDRRLVDPETGEDVVLKSGGGHSLFFTPMEYWAIIYVGIGVVLLFV